MDAYVAFIHAPEDDSAWGVIFPDVPGCVSAGDTFEEAVVNAREALSGHLAALQADGDPLPPRNTYEALIADPEIAEEAQGAVVQLIFPRLVAAERVRVNIMIDKGLLRRADETASANGLTRSAFIERALDQVVDA